MNIRNLVWPEEIIEKLTTKHSVQQQEVREILTKQSKYRYIEKGHRKGEDVYAAMGRTVAGRLLIVFFIHKEDGSALILSARDMTSRERKRYEQK